MGVNSTVMYGTSNGNLNMASHPALNALYNKHNNSIELVSLQSGTRYYYQINSSNTFDFVVTEGYNIITMDASELANSLHSGEKR